MIEFFLEAFDFSRIYIFEFKNLVSTNFCTLNRCFRERVSMPSKRRLNITQSCIPQRTHFITLSRFTCYCSVHHYVTFHEYAFFRWLVTNVTISYPSADQLEMGFERIITCQPALAEWTEYQGVVEREADTYRAGILYVKRRDSTPLDEELLMLWSRICLQYVDELGRFHPVSLMCKIWSRIWN
ncbi:hypothetical protein CcBV_32.11 [Bracoviriform congregatae]|uniref:Uncharacterized protein n=1 Tax=Bracoviriform congregatae TaxID=39640 RepID=Q5ZNT8_9VIRU|nr:hypothetical protein CcBV_32.11 [Bracoviriform congregatae]CAG18441.1 hypothetical protein CcBV_32.11 [Bracoviriform congregatae]